VRAPQPAFLFCLQYQSFPKSIPSPNQSFPSAKVPDVEPNAKRDRGTTAARENSPFRDSQRNHETASGRYNIRNRIIRNRITVTVVDMVDGPHRPDLIRIKIRRNHDCIDNGQLRTKE
jgi:hypothetical protein